MQAQILAFLRTRSNGTSSVSAVAQEMGVRISTVSEAVDTLRKKRLLLKTKTKSDRRVVNLRLTAKGRREAAAAASWPPFFSTAVDELSPDEQAMMLRGIMKLVKAMQLHGDIPVARMCVTCQFFRPHVHNNAERPHHCELVDAPFGDRPLRLDCPEHQPASQPQGLRPGRS